MEQVGNILPKALRKQLSARKPPVFEILSPLWAHVVGKLIAQHSRPVCFASGVLTLAASSPVWAGELRQISEQIRSQANTFLGNAAVRKIRVVQALGFEAQKETPAGPELANSVSLAEDEVRELLWPAGEIGIDPGLARVVERSFAKYFSRPGSPERKPS
jgi:hypothetical protein